MCKSVVVVMAALMAQCFCANVFAGDAAEDLSTGNTREELAADSMDNVDVLSIPNIDIASGSAENKSEEILCIDLSSDSYMSAQVENLIPLENNTNAKISEEYFSDSSASPAFSLLKSEQTDIDAISDEVELMEDSISSGSSVDIDTQTTTEEGGSSANAADTSSGSDDETETTTEEGGSSANAANTSSSGNSAGSASTSSGSDGETETTTEEGDSSANAADTSSGSDDETETTTEDDGDSSSKASRGGGSSSSKAQRKDADSDGDNDKEADKDTSSQKTDRDTETSDIPKKSADNNDNDNNDIAKEKENQGGSDSPEGENEAFDNSEESGFANDEIDTPVSPENANGSVMQNSNAGLSILPQTGSLLGTNEVTLLGIALIGFGVFLLKNKKTENYGKIMR